MIGGGLAATGGGVALAIGGTVLFPEAFWATIPMGVGMTAGGLALTAGGIANAASPWC